MRIGIRELRADLANLVRRAGAGEEVIVTVGGTPVARLGPLGGGSSSLDDLVASGAVVAPRARRHPEPEVVDVPVDARSDRALRDVR